jgi:hypothetical protein
MKYKVEMKESGKSHTIDASHFVADGMGVRFLDKDGKCVAMWPNESVGAIYPVEGTDA